MGVADRTLKTFDYISKGLLPLDDSLGLSRVERRLEEQILGCREERERVGRSRNNRRAMLRRGGKEKERPEGRTRRLDEVYRSI